MSDLHPGSAAAAVGGPVNGDRPATAESSPGELGRRGARGSRVRHRRDVSWLVLLPFTLYVTIFFLLPTFAVFQSAFVAKDPQTHASHRTMANITAALRGHYRAAFISSIRLALVTAVIGAIAGTMIGQVLVTSRRSGLRQIVLTASGVFANFGGVPLAFAFIATIGNAGYLATLLANTFGISLRDDLHISLYSFWGLVLVYLYFQIPLMVLVITPALDGLKKEWREAAENLGANTWSYWRHVGGPALLPPVVASTLLLFASGLSAFATAAALISGSFPLVTLQIRDVMAGNVLVGQEGIGAALGLWMIVLILLIVGVYVPLQRRSARWLR